MRQKYRTTCFADALVDYPGSLEDDPKWSEEVVGFRLVHDDANRVVRGGSWGDGPQSALVARPYGSAPARRLDYLGFRLVVGWREE